MLAWVRMVVTEECSSLNLIEWVRDAVLRSNSADLEKYFPPGRRLGISERWKKVVKELFQEKRILKAETFGGGVWADFKELVDLRDDLVHSNASRPTTASQAQSKDLKDLPVGWGTSRVRELILDLHRTVGSPPPSWVA
jgi:hypothetical protein